MSRPETPLSIDIFAENDDDLPVVIAQNRPETPLSIDIFAENESDHFEFDDDSIGLNNAFIEEPEEPSVNESHLDVDERPPQYGAGPVAKTKNYDFVEDWETDFFNLIALSDRALVLQRRNAARMALPPTRLLFRNLHKIPDGYTVEQAVALVLDIFIRMVIGEAGGNLTDTQFCVGLFHPGFMEDKGFWIKKRRYQNTTGSVLMNEISRFAQSNRDISIDEAFKMEIHVFKNPTMIGGSRIGVKKFLGTDLQARVQGSGLCLPKAVAIGKIWWDMKDPKNDEDTRKKHAACFKNLARTDRDCSNQQKEAALDILRYADMDLTKQAHDLTDLEKIAASMPEYRFSVWTKQDWQKTKTKLKLDFEANQTSTKIISLVYKDNHFDFVEPTRRKLGVSFCLKCRQYGDNKHYTVCKVNCLKCGHTNCLESNIKQEIECVDCNVVFGSSSCYNKHKKPTERGSKSNCEKIKMCKDCGKRYFVINYRNGQTHVCGDNAYCTICREHTNPKKPHNCCHNPPGPKELVNMKKKQEKYRCLVYDFESIIVNDLNAIETSATDHKPNLVCYRMFCSDCKGGQCRACTSGEFSYADPKVDDVVEEFAKFLLTDTRLDGAHILAHNGGRYDHNFLVPAMMNLFPIAPEFIANGQTIISVDIVPPRNQGRSSVKWNGLALRDSIQYLPMALSAMPKAFGLTEMKKGYFPYFFNVPENYGKVFDGLPAKQYYDYGYMKLSTRTDFDDWYEKHQKDQFAFDKEILDYCRSDVDILTNAVVKFIEICVTRLGGWNPILSARTLAGFVGFLLKNEHIKPGDIGFIPENGYPGRNNSTVALKYLMWLEENGTDVQHVRNGGEVAIKCSNGKTYYVDGYDATNKTIYEVHGCIHHGCKDCYDPQAFNAVRKDITNEGLLLATETRRREIEAEGYNVVEIWEHEIDEMLEKNQEMRQFFKNCRHTTQLLPREAMYGGRVQPFRAIVEASLTTGIHYLDYCSLYPYVNMLGAEYPRGQPLVMKSGFDALIGATKLSVRGLIYATVLPPRDLKLPVLPYRVDGKLLFPLCRSCAEKRGNKACNHHCQNERVLTGVWATDEMNKALEKGYQILDVYEVWHWDDWMLGGYFESYLTPLLKMKHEASGWPRENMSDEDKDKHIKMIHENDGVLIDKDCVVKNPALRSLAKLFLNSAWGKFAENPLKVESRIFDIEDHVGQAAFINDPAFEFKQIADWDDKYTFVSRVLKKEALTTRGFANVVIGVITTSAGRLRLYEAMERLGDHLCYCDTDSVIFTKHKDEDLLGDLVGQGLGKLEDEVADGDRITKLIAIASKVYAYELTHSDGSKTVVCKAKGVTLDATSTSQVSMEAMEKMMKQHLAEVAVDPIVTTRRGMRRKIFEAPQTIKMSKRLRPVTDKVRMNPDGSSLPLGWLPRD